MQLSSGYYFLTDRALTPVCGFVRVSVFNSAVKIQCVAEQLPKETDKTLFLCLFDSFNPGNNFVLGKMYLTQGKKQIKGEVNLTLRKINRALWQKFDCYGLIDNSGNIILQTKAPKKIRPPFDPFKTTNAAYSWDRAESATEFAEKLSMSKITPLPAIREEIKEGLKKYRHILLGNYKTQQKSYFIIGIPGNKPTLQPDFIYRWINKVVSLEEYPFFEGYKLYYFDTETSAAVKAVLRTQPAGNQR